MTAATLLNCSSHHNSQSAGLGLGLGQRWPNGPMLVHHAGGASATIVAPSFLSAVPPPAPALRCGDLAAAAAAAKYVASAAYNSTTTKAAAAGWHGVAASARQPGFETATPSEVVKTSATAETTPVRPVTNCVIPGAAVTAVSNKLETVKKEANAQEQQVKPTDCFSNIKKRPDRYNGVSEAELQSRTLPDYLVHDLDLLIIGINPGLFAAYKGHHYAGPGNHFWKCLFLSGLIPKPLTADDDYTLLNYGIGFTNIVQRTTKCSSELKSQEIRDGAKLLLEKIRCYRPKIAVFNGKEIYRIFSSRKEFHFGRQAEPVDGTQTLVYVMPSSSARCSQLPRASDKLPFYAALRKLRDHARAIRICAADGRRPPTPPPDCEVTFDSALPTAPRRDPLNTSPKKDALLSLTTTTQQLNNRSPSRSSVKRSASDQKKISHNNDDDDRAKAVDPKASLQRSSHRVFLDLKFSVKDEPLTQSTFDDHNEDDLAKASSSKHTSSGHPFDDKLPDTYANPVAFYCVPNGSTGPNVSPGDLTKRAPEKRPSNGNGAEPFNGPPDAKQQRGAAGNVGGPLQHVSTTVTLPGGGAYVAPTFNRPNSAVNGQMSFVRCGEGDGQAHQDVSGDGHSQEQSPSTAAQQQQQSQQQRRGSVASDSGGTTGGFVQVSATSNGPAPTTAVAAATSAFQQGAPPSLTNDEMKQLYASVLGSSAVNNGSNGGGGMTSAVDVGASSGSHAMFQDFSTADSADHMSSDHLQLMQSQQMQEHYLTSQQQQQQQQQQLLQMQHQQLLHQQQQQFMGNGSESRHQQMAPAQQQASIGRLASTSMVAIKSGGAQQGSAAPTPKKQTSMTPDVAQHVCEAIDAVVQRARDGPLPMPAFKTPPEKAAAAAAHAQQHHQQQQQAAQQHQQQQLQQQHQQQQQQVAQQQQQSQQQQQQVQQQQQLLNLQMQAAVANAAAAAQFDLGRSMKNAPDNTAAVAAALLGAGGTYDQNCQGGASLYTQYFQQQQQNHQQQASGSGGASGGQFGAAGVSPFNAVSNTATGAVSYATPSQWPAVAFSTTASQAVGAAAPVYATHPMTAATYFQAAAAGAPLYHQNAAAAAALAAVGGSPYFQVNVNPTAAQQQAMYGQYAAASGTGFGLQQQQSPHNL